MKNHPSKVTRGNRSFYVTFAQPAISKIVPHPEKSNDKKNISRSVAFGVATPLSPASKSPQLTARTFSQRSFTVDPEKPFPQFSPEVGSGGRVCTGNVGGGENGETGSGGTGAICKRGKESNGSGRARLFVGGKRKKKNFVFFFGGWEREKVR